MAAPTFSLAAAGATDAAGAWTYTSGVSFGTGLGTILQVLQDGTTDAAVTFTSFSSVSNLADTANAMTQIVGPNGDGSWPVGSPASARQFLWIGRSAGVPSASGGNSTSEDLYYRWYGFADVSTGTTLDTVIENGSAGVAVNGVGTGTTVSDTGVTTLGADRLALQFVALNDDVAIDAFAGMSGGTWAEAVAEYAEASGTDGALQLQLSSVFDIGYFAATYLNTASILGATGSAEMNAQSFTTTGAITANFAFVVASKNNAPTDNLVVEIQTNSGGVPSGTVVGTGGSIPASDISTSPRQISVAINASLSAGTTYWLVMRRSGARDTSNYFETHANSSAYAGGTGAERTSGTWSTSTNDYGFGIISSVTGDGTINGGSDTIVSAGWGVVGFALIGTTAAPPAALVTPQPGIDFGSTAVL